MTLSFTRAALVLGGVVMLLGASAGFAAAQAAPAITTQQHYHAGVGKLVHGELALAATTLGYPDVKSMRKDLAGTTLTDLAPKHNVAPATLSAALKSDLDAKIQALVDAGTIKAKRGAALKVKAEAKVDALMTRQFKVK